MIKFSDKKPNRDPRSRVQPRKSLGQNWLKNPNILDKIVAAAEINSNDFVIEVGPGKGSLTEKLIPKAGRVVAIEKDHRLIESLKEKFKSCNNLEIIEDDILKFDPMAYGLAPSAYKVIRHSNYKVIGNIPYYLTSHLIRTIFEQWPKPELIVFTIQKEVARRIMEKPPHTNMLALSVQYYAEPKIVSYISKENFRPAPKVDSAIIRLRPYDKSQITRNKLQTNSNIQTLNPKQEKELFNLIRIGFSEKRKQLAGTLSKQLKIPKEETIKALNDIGVGDKVRPENLSLEQWQSLSQILLGKASQGLT